MIILEKPYVSDFLVETIKKNNFQVLDNEVSRDLLSSKYLLNDLEAKQNIENQLLYSNSENSIDWVLNNAKNSKVAELIKISKDKAIFRDAISEIYPNYFYKKVSIKELKEIKTEELKFPFILKPTTGFLSFGVYPVKNINDWNNILQNIDSDILKFKDIFPKNVVDTEYFLIEEMIDGEEFALDAYFDENGEATILNIFKHPFFDADDVSDRVYYTSKAILKKYLANFKKVLDKIGKCANYKNFPFHLELRANDKEIIPIELNPLRFCGWCITDIAYFAYGINVYEYYFKKLKPDWDKILDNTDDDYYYFTIGDIPSNVDRNQISKINFDKYLKNIEKPLEIRKIDYKANPVFAIVFAKTSSVDEIKNILKLDMNEFIS